MSSSWPGRSRASNPEPPGAEAADAAGYLMTPILVVDGQVVHHGSVPTEEPSRVANPEEVVSGGIPVWTVKPPGLHPSF